MIYGVYLTEKGTETLHYKIGYTRLDTPEVRFRDYNRRFSRVELGTVYQAPEINWKKLEKDFHEKVCSSFVSKPSYTFNGKNECYLPNCKEEIDKLIVSMTKLPEYQASKGFPLANENLRTLKFFYNCPNNKIIPWDSDYYTLYLYLFNRKCVDCNISDLVKNLGFNFNKTLAMFRKLSEANLVSFQKIDKYLYKDVRLNLNNFKLCKQSHGNPLRVLNGTQKRVIIKELRTTGRFKEEELLKINKELSWY